MTKRATITLWKVVEDWLDNQPRSYKLSTDINRLLMKEYGLEDTVKEESENVQQNRC